VHVGDDRHRTGVRTRGFGERGPVISPSCSAGRVRPVQCLVDRQQVRQVVPVRVDQLVDPLDPDRPVPLGLDRERGCMMKQDPLLARRLDGSVSPYRRRRESGRQDLLLELPHRDLVGVGRFSTRQRHGARPRHDRRDQ
jgi:hypothetical protein